MQNCVCARASRVCVRALPFVFVPHVSIRARWAYPIIHAIVALRPSPFHRLVGSGLPTFGGLLPSVTRALLSWFLHPLPSESFCPASVSARARAPQIDFTCTNLTHELDQVSVDHVEEAYTGLGNIDGLRLWWERERRHAEGDTAGSVCGVGRG